MKLDIGIFYFFSGPFLRVGIRRFAGFLRQKYGIGIFTGYAIKNRQKSGLADFFMGWIGTRIFTGFLRQQYGFGIDR